MRVVVLATCVRLDKGFGIAKTVQPADAAHSSDAVGRCTSHAPAAVAQPSNPIASACPFGQRQLLEEKANDNPAPPLACRHIRKQTVHVAQTFRRTTHLCLAWVGVPEYVGCAAVLGEAHPV